MKFLKRYKGYILSFVLGAVLFSSITAYAAILVAASDVSLSSTKTTTTNLKDSLDELYLLAANSDYDTLLKSNIETWGAGYSANTGEAMWYATPKQLHNMTSSGNYFVISQPGSYIIFSDAVNIPKLYINDKNVAFNKYSGIGAFGIYNLKAGDKVHAHNNNYGWSCSMVLIKISDKDITSN